MRSNNRSESSFIVKSLRNLVLILVLVVFGSITYNFFFRARESQTIVALMADASSSKEIKGVFIRDEEPLTFSGNGVLSYSVVDGGKLGSGTVIAEVYSDDEQISIKTQIAQLEKKLSILKKIQNPGTIESAQPASLSDSIEESYRSLIYCRDKGDYDTLKNEMENLVVQMSTYQLITNEVSSFGQQITDINSQLAELKASSVKPAETIRSPHSAYFVSYCDGYESELTPDKLSSITISELSSITDRKSDDTKIVGKLIEGYGWYLAGIIDNSKKEYSIGETVRLRFESSSESFRAEITDIRDEGDPSRSIIVMECAEFNYDLVQHRAENCDIIKGEYRGLKVPREAIRFADVETTVTDEATGEETTEVQNCKGVYILKGEQVEFKKINVIYEGSDYVLSEVKDEDKSFLALYDNIMIEGV